MLELSQHACDVLVGTPGYGYIEWVGPVYPEEIRPEDFLTRYAPMFPLRKYALPRLILFYRNVNTVARSGKALAGLMSDAGLATTTGLYFEGYTAIKSSDLSYNAENRKELWKTRAAGQLLGASIADLCHCRLFP
jgi:hypothetical protein